MERDKTYIDKEIPIEKQIQYLRYKFSSQGVRTYKFFRQEFGDRADELYGRLYNVYTICIWRIQLKTTNSILATYLFI